MKPWTNKAFAVRWVDGAILSHMVDANGVFIFRWRMFYDEETYEEFNLPFGVIEEFETFLALCRQFDTPADVKKWYLKKIGR